MINQHLFVTFLALCIETAIDCLDYCVTKEEGGDEKEIIFNYKYLEDKENQERKDKKKASDHVLKLIHNKVC